jgi:hypothetical protein
MTTSNPALNPLAVMAATPMTQQKKSGDGTWFEAMAEAWGQTLDAQADRITEQSDIIAAGDDRPGSLTALTTESLKMSFLANGSQTSISSVGQALETMARKQ